MQKEATKKRVMLLLVPCIKIIKHCVPIFFITCGGAGGGSNGARNVGDVN